MINEIKDMAQLGGTVVTVLLFLYYLHKKDIGFDKIINNHLHSSNKIIKENSRALKKVAVNMKELSMMIRKNGKK